MDISLPNFRLQKYHFFLNVQILNNINIRNFKIHQFYLPLKYNPDFMKPIIYLGISFWALLLIFACKADDISFDSPSQELRFSQDTVFLDTIYNQVRSETYAVKVYNQEDKDVLIPKISLEGGTASPYRINVDGIAGTEFNNVPLRKNDSLYIFVEIAPVANATEAIAEDRVLFQNNAGNQHVTLFSVVQDAEFFIKTDTNPNVLTDNTTWTNNKAKIVFGELTLAEGKTLNIEKGTKVYFTKNSGLTVSKDASLNISGDLNEEVVFRGDRNDTKYDTIPLNWRGINFEAGSNLTMNYAKIFGGETGLKLQNSTANIKNSVIHTFEKFGIYAINSVITAQNMVMNNCGEANLGIFKGGNIDLTHCTLANYWQNNNSLPGYSLYATNGWINDSGSTENGGLILNVKNSIIYGNKENSVIFKPVAGQTFSYLFDHSLLKHGNDAGFSFDGNANVVNSIKNEDPIFLNYYTQKMNLRVADDSPAKGKGRVTTAQSVPVDILKISRTASPTIGAYQ